MHQMVWLHLWLDHLTQQMDHHVVVVLWYGAQMDHFVVVVIWSESQMDHFVVVELLY